MIRELAFLTLFGCTSVSACAEPQQYQTVNHCAFYEEHIPLQDLIRNADFTAIIEVVEDHSDSKISKKSFKVLTSYFGVDQSEVELLAAYAANFTDFRAEITNRLEYHSTQRFFWSANTNPLSFGFERIGSVECNMIPIVVPNQKYIIAKADNQILLFEPLSDNSEGLIKWFDFYEDKFR